MIEFVDDHDGCLFTATVTRKPVEELDLVGVGASKDRDAPGVEPKNAFQRQIIEFIRSNPTISYDELAHLTGKDRTTIMRNIAKLKALGLLKRIGPRKGGHWEIVE